MLWKYTSEHYLAYVVLNSDNASPALHHFCEFH